MKSFTKIALRFFARLSWRQESRVLDNGETMCYTSEEGDEAAAAVATADALPFAGSIGVDIGRRCRVEEPGRRVVYGNEHGTNESQDLEEEVPEYRPWWPPGHWWLSGWQHSFELDAVLYRVKLLTYELDLLLQSGCGSQSHRRLELGSELAHYVALVAAYSERLLSEGDRSHHDI